MKKNVDISKLHPVIRIAPAKRNFSTTKRKRKHIVKYVMPKYKEKALFVPQNTVAEETVGEIQLHDTKGGMKVTKYMPILCFK